MPIRGQIVLVAAVLAGAWGCHTVVEEMPQSPTEPVVAPIPIVVVPVPVPQPTGDPGGPAPAPAPGPPQPSPAPAPGPTPAPGTPAPAPAPPTGQACRLPPGNGSGHNCPRQSPSFLGELEASLDQLARQEPSLFDLTRTRGCGNCYLVRNIDRYVARVAEVMTARGICARFDGEELAAKNSNAFNDQYDIITADGYIRRQGGSYRATCYPAAF
jgi:hypothetical protein